ncbi:MAG: ABC transporter ATP-binding protein [Candidatus Woesearchaeota archaeon]
MHVTVDNVSKRYGTYEVLRPLSIDIPKGKIASIAGASGCGKTTLLHMIIGYVASSSGTILLDGKPPQQKKHDIGFSAQQPSIYPKLSVQENLALFGGFYNLTPKSLAKNATILLHLVGLHAYRHFLAEQLSGGMLKRLDIACALMHNPSLLILDEPTANLDISMREQIWTLIKDINSKGTTVLISSHFVDELMELSDIMFVIKDKTIAYKGTPAQLSVHQYDTIVLHTLKGVYDAYTSLEGKQKGYEYHIATKHIQKTMQEVLKIANKQKDTILSLHVVKSSIHHAYEELIHAHSKHHFKKS